MILSWAWQLLQMQLSFDWKALCEMVRERETRDMKRQASQASKHCRSANKSPTTQAKTQQTIPGRKRPFAANGAEREHRAACMLRHLKSPRRPILGYYSITGPWPRSLDFLSQGLTKLLRLVFTLKPRQLSNFPLSCLSLPWRWENRPTTLGPSLKAFKRRIYMFV